MRRFALLGCLLILSATAGAHAQSSASPLSPNDSLFRRARRLVSEGNGTAGRAMVDSLLKREQEGTTAYGNALYWRGALAETAADAERDYRRVIVEYPLSAYSDDALLAIAELEQARGDRSGALAHLQRFVKEHPVSAARGTAAFAAARLAFEQRDTRIACAMLTEARASVLPTDVELRNQIDYYGARCPAVDVSVTPPSVSAPVVSAPVAPAPVIPPKTVGDVVRKTPVPTTPAKPTRAKPAAPTPATTTSKAVDAPPVTVQGNVPRTPAARGTYTIQLAAFNTRAEAERLVKKLGTSGVAARVSGASRPYRVRLGFYPTRQAALDEVAALKQRGIIAFVTTEGPPEAKTP